MMDFVSTSWDFFWDEFPSVVGFICAWVVPVILLLAILGLSMIIISILRRGKSMTRTIQGLAPKPADE